MAITISIALQKGGVGKSTTAQNLATHLGAKKKRVLLIDLDAQGNVTYSSGIDEAEFTITDLLSENCEPDKAVTKCRYYDLVCSDEYLTNVENGEVEPTLLKNSMQSLKDRYDFIIIDTPPALGNLSINSLVASDYIIIPTEPRPYAMQGIARLYETIKTIKENANPDLQILGILLIKYSNRTVLNRDAKEMIEEYAKQISTTVFKTSIREGIAIPESQMLREPLNDYAKNSNPNIDYKELTTEVLKRIKKLESE